MSPEELKQLIELCWLLVCAGLVFFMQAGFACLEAGAVRHKNSINVAIKNIVDFCVAFPVFVVIGYALMFNPTIGGFVGEPILFLKGISSADMAKFLYQVTFCGTAATIVSGGVAERCRFLAYMLISGGVSAIIYPLFGHWAWGGGWLMQMGYVDFAGSSVVHMVGGGVALAGILVLGPRSGRFGPNGESNRIPASSMPLVALGVLILMFGWIGFNGGSAPLGPNTASIIVNTLMAGCVAGVTALLFTWAYGGLAAIDMVLNGLLGGLVAITACAHCLPVTAAAVVGVLAGVVLVGSTIMLEKLRIDDAVGAVPVHFFCGILGVLCVAIFGTIDSGVIPSGYTRLGFLGLQALGVTVCATWSIALGWLLWMLVGYITKVRVDKLEEEVGLNFSEHMFEDAIHDLTLAVQRVSSSRETPDIGALDNVRDSEVAALVQAIKSLVGRTAERMKNMEQWSHKVDDVKKSLGVQSSQGVEAASRAARELLQVGQTLDHVLKYLREHQAAHSLFPVLADLITSVRRQLQDLTQSLPDTVESWNSVQQAAGRLNHIHLALAGGK